MPHAENHVTGQLPVCTIVTTHVALSDVVHHICKTRRRYQCSLGAPP